MGRKDGLGIGWWGGRGESVGGVGGKEKGRRKSGGKKRKENGGREGGRDNKRIW